MKLMLKLLAFFFLAPFTLAAQRGQSVLWKVSGHGLTRPSYLFGTVHTLPPAVLDKFPLKQYQAQAQFGVFEFAGIPIGPARPPGSRLPEPPQRPQPPLDSLFNKRDYAAVDSFFSASPLGSIKGHNNDTDLLALLFAARRLKQNRAAQQVSLDASIAEEMQRLGKPIFSLDDDDDPDIRRVKTGYSQLANAVVATVREKASKEYVVPDDATGAYVARLFSNMRLREDATDGLGLTVRRNLRWCPLLEQKMHEGSCFVAVGLNHLRFNSGLIQLLRQKGYRLKPVALAKID